MLKVPLAILNRYSRNTMGRRHKGARKKPLDIGGSPDHVTLGSGTIGLGLQIGGDTARLCIDREQGRFPSPLPGVTLQR